MKQSFYYSSDGPSEPGAPMEAGSTGEAKPPRPTRKKKKPGTRVEYLSGEGEKKLNDLERELGLHNKDRQRD